MPTLQAGRVTTRKDIQVKKQQAPHLKALSRKCEAYALKMLRAKYTKEFRDEVLNATMIYVTENRSHNFPYVRAGSVLKRRYPQEYRAWFNEEAKRLGYETAEIRRDIAIAKLQAQIDALKAKPLRCIVKGQ